MMAQRYSYILCSGLLVLGMLGHTAEAAPRSPVQATPTPTAEQIVESRKALGRIQRNVILYRSEIQKAEKQLKDENVGRLTRGHQDNIIMHVKGQTGLLFEEPSPVELDPEQVKQFKDKAVELFKDTMKEYLDETTQKEHLRVCEKDTRRVVRKMRKDDKRRETYHDVLFLPKSLKPENTDEVFGERTKVVEIADQNIAGYQQLIARFGLSCFPLRIHLGKRGLEQMEGETALRNYDENERDGVLDRNMESEWNRFKRRASLAKEGL